MMAMAGCVLSVPCCTSLAFLHAKIGRGLRDLAGSVHTFVVVPFWLGIYTYPSCTNIPRGLKSSPTELPAPLQSTYTFSFTQLHLSRIVLYKPQVIFIGNVS